MYTVPHTWVPGDFLRASWLNLYTTDLEDHEDRIVALEALELSALADVGIASPIATGDVLVYDGATWTNRPLVLEDLADLSLSSPVTAGDWLQYTGAAWENVRPDPFAVLTPGTGEAPGSNAATAATRNAHPVLDFDDTTGESAMWTRQLPPSYAGNGLSVAISWVAASATTGGVVWEVAIERIDALGLDLDADSFATAQSVTATAPGTSGQVRTSTVTFTAGAQMDSLAAGELFRIKIARNPGAGGDTMTGDAELVLATIAEP